MNIIYQGNQRVWFDKTISSGRYYMGILNESDRMNYRIKKRSFVDLGIWQYSRSTCPHNHSSLNPNRTKSTHVSSPSNLCNRLSQLLALFFVPSFSSQVERRFSLVVSQHPNDHFWRLNEGMCIFQDEFVYLGSLHFWEGSGLWSSSHLKRPHEQGSNRELLQCLGRSLHRGQLLLVQCYSSELPRAVSFLLPPLSPSWFLRVRTNNLRVVTDPDNVFVLSAWQLINIDSASL